MILWNSVQYKLYLICIKESPVRSQNKWAQELGVQIDDKILGAFKYCMLRP
jgi:hypothetical protein